MFGQFVRNCLRSLGGPLPVRSEFQENPIPRLISYLPTLDISVVIHDSLGLDQLFSNAVKHFIHVIQHVVNDVYVQGSQEVFWEIEGLADKGNLIWGGPYSHVPRSIVGPFNPREKLSPRSGPAMNK